MLPTIGALANAKIKPLVACGPGTVGQLIEICLNWLNIIIVRKNESPILITDAEETDKFCGIQTSDFGFHGRESEVTGIGCRVMCDARTTRRDRDISP